MKWFVVKLVFQIINNSKIQQFDEQLRIVSALDYEDAYKKANEIAKNNEYEFSDFKNNIISWKFIAIPYLEPLIILENGTELCSQILEKEQNENYLFTLKLKQEAIVNRTLKHCNCI
ncbi:MAG: DUF4288 domain-containing protein [Bacteroidetes bacterium]|nr:DUF4288 domain-containing protein [Bacteroidota bacterium]